MWRPNTVGQVFVERVVQAERRGRAAQVVKIRFGRPVRAPRPEPGDPWWCPMQVSGAGINFFKPIAGYDSMQSLVLALEHATSILPGIAAEANVRLNWLGDAERLVFARQAISGATDGVLNAALGRLKLTARILDSGSVSDGNARRRIAEVLDAIAAPIRGQGKARPSSPRGKRKPRAG